MAPLMKYRNKTGYRVMEIDITFSGVVFEYGKIKIKKDIGVATFNKCMQALGVFRGRTAD